MLFISLSRLGAIVKTSSCMSDQWQMQASCIVLLAFPTQHDIKSSVITHDLYSIEICSYVYTADYEWGHSSIGRVCETPGLIFSTT